MRRQYLPIEQLQAWSRLNGIRLYTAAITSSIRNGTLGKGAGLIATNDISADDAEQFTLLSVPSDLILSLERVEACAKTDKDLRDVLIAVGELARVGCCVFVFSYNIC